MDSPGELEWDLVLERAQEWVLHQGHIAPIYLSKGLLRCLVLLWTHRVFERVLEDRKGCMRQRILE